WLAGICVLCRSPQIIHCRIGRADIAHATAYAETMANLAFRNPVVQPQRCSVIGHTDHVIIDTLPKILLPPHILPCGRSDEIEAIGQLRAGFKLDTLASGLRVFGEAAVQRTRIGEVARRLLADTILGYAERGNTPEQRS